MGEEAKDAHKEILDLHIQDDRLMISKGDLHLREEHLIISKEQLEEEYLPQDLKVYPGFKDARKIPEGKKGIVDKSIGTILATTFYHSLFLGIFGGFLAWIFTEMTIVDTSYQLPLKVLFKMALFGGMVAFFISIPLGAGEGLYSKQYHRAFKDSLFTCIPGFFIGFIGGGLGQLLYSLLGGGRSLLLQQILARTLGWGTLGLGVGFALGVGQGLVRQGFSWPPGPAMGKRMMNGLIGGTIGGSIGGLLFDGIGLLTKGGLWSRAIAMTLLGGCIGATISIVTSARREAWLTIMKGHLKGKEFLIYGGQTKIGKSPTCDIVLYQDEGIAHEHALLLWDGQRCVLKGLDGREGIILNNRPVKEKTLKNADTIKLGSVEFMYHEQTETSK